MPAVPRPDPPPAGPPLGANAAAPIGVFDSGVGGLSVLSALVRKLAHEDFVYLGDTARLPYGSAPAAMVRGFPGVSAALAADGLERLGLARPTAATPGRVLQLVTGDLENFRHLAAILGGPAGEVLPLRRPVAPRPAWPARAEAAA